MAAKNSDAGLINYIYNEEAKTMRAVPDENFDGARKKSESIIAQFEGEEDCEQFEMAIRRLRPDIEWVD